MKKFLLNASSGIGDIMFFLPAVLALKETYPDSQIGFLFRGDETTKETVSSILSIAHNKIDDLQYYNNSNFIHNFKVLLQLKLQKTSIASRTSRRSSAVPCARAPTKLIAKEVRHEPSLSRSGIGHPSR